MGQLQELDRLNAWLRMAIRQAALSYRDGRREDDANTPPGHEKGAGWPMKAAQRRMERTAVLLLDALATKAKEIHATKPQAEAASIAVREFLNSMAQDVKFVALRIAPDSPDAQSRIDELVNALVADADGALGLVVADARVVVTGTGRAKAKPGPDIDMAWRQKVWSYCDKVGKEDVANPEWSARLFLLDVKQFYKLAFDAPPKDARRTNQFRQQWLDAKAGLTR